MSFVFFFPWKDSAFSLSLGEIMEQGRSVCWQGGGGAFSAQDWAESLRLLSSLEMWWLRHHTAVCSGAVQLSNKGKWRHWGSISCSRTLTFHRAYRRWVMGRVLGLQPGDPMVTICVTFTHLCNPSEIQFPHLWNADDTYWFGRRFRELMCVWSRKGICVL